MHDYSEFLDAKVHSESKCGFEPVEIPSVLHDVQRVLTEWAIRRGRAAIFADLPFGMTSESIACFLTKNLANQTMKSTSTHCNLTSSSELLFCDRILGKLS